MSRILQILKDAVTPVYHSTVSEKNKQPQLKKRNKRNKK